MIIEISKISSQGSRYTGEESADFLALEPDSEVEAEPLRYDLKAEIVSGELMVQGGLTMPFRLCCSRCAVFFSTTVRISSFLRVYPLCEGQVEVDVTPAIREEVLLELPHHPRCSEHCAGLCPKCGVNLNHGACTCVPEADRGPWDSLDGLFVRPGS